MLFFNLVLKMDVYITVTFSCKLSIDIKDNVDAKFPMHKVTFQFTTFFSSQYSSTQSGYSIILDFIKYTLARCPMKMDMALVIITWHTI